MFAGDLYSRKHCKARCGADLCISFMAFAGEPLLRAHLHQDLKANVFAAGRPSTKVQMIDQSRSYLASTQKRPDVVRSFFQETHVAYAAD